jgi:hypothetical protein
MGVNRHADIVTSDALTDYANGTNTSGRTVAVSCGVTNNFILYSGGYHVSNGGVVNNTEADSGGVQTVCDNVTTAD